MVIKIYIQYSVVYFVIYILSLHIHCRFLFIISEFSKHQSVSENVMVITFGRDVKVIQHYSNKHKTISRCVGNTFHSFHKIIELSPVFGLLFLKYNNSCLIFWLIDGLECEGGSPLQEGIVLSLSGISSGMLFIHLIKKPIQNPFMFMSMYLSIKSLFLKDIAS